jgi:hypothetical protein
MDRFAVISTKVRKDHNGVMRFSIENHQNTQIESYARRIEFGCHKTKKKEGVLAAPSSVKD